MNKGWTKSFPGLTRVISKDPYTVAEVWNNVNDPGNWRAQIECKGSMDITWWMKIRRRNNGFSRRTDAVRWADREMRAVRRILADFKVSGSGR